MLINVLILVYLHCNGQEATITSYRESTNLHHISVRLTTSPKRTMRKFTLYAQTPCMFGLG